MPRINVFLDPDEATALFQLAERECWHPREQARFLIRQGLQQATPPAPSDPTTQPPLPDPSAPPPLGLGEDAP